MASETGPRRIGLVTLAALTAMGLAACTPSGGEDPTTPAPTAEPTTTQEATEAPTAAEPTTDTTTEPGADPSPTAGAGELPVWQPGFSPEIEFEGTPAGFTANEEVLEEDWAPQWIGENGCEFQATPFDYETVEELEETGNAELAVERLVGLLTFLGADGGRDYEFTSMPGPDGEVEIPFVTTGAELPTGYNVMVATTASHGPLDPGPGHSAIGFDVTYLCPGDVMDMQTGWDAILETARVTMAFNPEVPGGQWPADAR